MSQDIRIRPFRNSDPPALVQIWNQAMPAGRAAAPLSVYELDALAFGTPEFDRLGLLVAENVDSGELLGFAHAGFGPPDPEIAPLQYDREMGSIAMLAIRSDRGDADSSWVGRLIVEAERYLKDRGAKVFYAGGLRPLNPFYWGLYGGSEFSGIVDSHTTFRDAVIRAGYQPMARSVMLEVNLAQGDFKDPRAILIRRSHRIEIQEEARLPSWWDDLHLAPYRPAIVRVIAKSDNSEIASAMVWSMDGFLRSDNRARLGLIGLQVHPSHRRKGYGRFLVGEILRAARIQYIDAVQAVTDAVNEGAIALYESLRFERIDECAMYRLPVGEGLRQAGDDLPNPQG